MPVRLRDAIQAIPAYKQGRPAPEGGFKLSSNENPFPPLPSVVDAIVEQAATVNRYPAAGAPSLVAALAAKHGVAPERIMVSDGSVSGIMQLVTAVAGPGDEVVFAWRSFEAYPLLVQVAGATPIMVPLTPTAEHDLDAMAAAITERTRAVFVCSPNNPTGPIVTQEQWDAFIAKVPSDVLVMLDEAYIEFVQVPVVDGLAAQAAHDNVVILRTFSKAYGLAGLRVGYAIGDPTIIGAATISGIPLSVTGLATQAALASIAAEGELFARVEQLAADRDALQQRLADAGTPVPEAHGNFVWVAARPDQAEAIAEILDDVAIVARQFPDGVRITVAEREAHDGIVDAVRRIRELA
ncbi:histidinol-phosphate transaminase [Agrococcus jejuensis]|uniref:histidinol-phosphate transaminase n=1 Tax=Agrococcus jejuensis TaxID=399736 RepID=UPI0021B59C5E|nr:histidinol-phosphate transaminase [Agrococcus jejuensis]